MVIFFIITPVVMEGIMLADIPVANPAVVFRDGPDGGKVMVNCDTGAAIAVNRTGALIWVLIDGRRSPREIAEAVRRNFADAPDTVNTDVSVLLTTLSEDGFIGYEVKGQTNNF
jgi:hypothetical protein